jgi:hypothetical protein
MTKNDLGTGLASGAKTEFLAWNNFRFARNPPRIEAKRGEHFLQVDSAGLSEGKT